MDPSQENNGHTGQTESTTRAGSDQIPKMSTPPIENDRNYGREWMSDAFRPFDPRRKSSLLASFLSVLPGLGQIYVGYYQAGFLNAMVIGSLLTLGNSQFMRDYQDFTPFIVFSTLFYWLYNIVDAGRRAALYNHIAAQGRPIDLPASMPSPKIGGSIIGGIILLAFGFALLLHTKFDFSLAWVKDWWPIAPMGLGGYLLTMGVMDRIKRD